MRAVARMAREIVERNGGTEDLVLMGIHRRGTQIADLLQDEIERAEGVSFESGSIDITLYRDDLGGRRAAARDRRLGAATERDRRPKRRHRRRRGLHGPDRARRAQRARRLGAAASGSSCACWWTAVSASSRSSPTSPDAGST